jgi:acyl carrier protein
MEKSAGTKERVIAAIRAVLQECRLGTADDAGLEDGPLDLDSVEAVELIIKLEREFKIVIEDWELAEHPLKTVDEIVLFCEAKTRGQGRPTGSEPGGVL